MWKWIKEKLFGKKRTPSSEEEYAFNYFAPEEQEIYTYWDGTQMVKADPMVLHKRMMDVGPELAGDIAASRSGMKGAKEGHDSLIKKIRHIFSLKPFEEGGLVEGNVIKLFNHFLLYEDIQKKIANLLQTSAEETSTISNPSSVANSPTPNTTASGSTANEPSTVPPTPSPSVPEPPSVTSNPASNTSEP